MPPVLWGVSGERAAHGAAEKQNDAWAGRTADLLINQDPVSRSSGHGSERGATSGERLRSSPGAPTFAQDTASSRLTGKWQSPWGRRALGLQRGDKAKGTCGTQGCI